MNATTHDLPGAALDETVVHQPNPDRGPDAAEPRPTATAGHRFTFSSGARPLDGYTIKRAIGRGGFGEVYYATSDAGKEVALKLITRNLDVERRGVVQCMNLKSPNLITIFDLKTSDAGDTFVIMEYVAGPSLASILNQYPNGMPLKDVRAWMRGLVEGVAYLHDHGIVHRDLKPANLFLEEGIVKIGDYGLSKAISQSQETGHSESIGTCHYMAPEISTGKYHKPIDIYAMGVIHYEMMTGRVPFDGETVGEILMKHLTARPDVSMLAEPYRSIIARALAKDPKQRPSNVYELLPEDDRPEKPPVRFIGAGKETAPEIPTDTLQRPEDDDVLRIGVEEPVFYIGPDTRPPGQRWKAFRQWFWTGRPQPAGRSPRRSPATRRTRPGAGSAPVVPRPAPPPRPVELPPPPPLPSGRVRVAESAASMLWAAPLALVLTVPAAALLGLNVTEQPQHLAYLFLMTLLGSWGALVTGQLLEGRAVDAVLKRLFFLGVGLVLGVLSLALDHWIQLDLARAGPRPFVGSVGPPPELGHLTYFGLAFAALGWWKLSNRDRPARFRFGPVIVAAGLGLLAVPFWPYALPMGLAVLVMVAIVLQLVSPWNADAATYARAMKKRQRA